MGRARIVGGGTAGLYTIEPIYNERLYRRMRARLSQRLDELDAFITDVDQQLVSARQDASAAESDLANAQDALIARLREVADDPDLSTEDAASERSAYDQALGEARVAGQRVSALETSRSRAALERDELQARIGRMDDQKLSQVQVWCVDLTEDEAGEVGTIEVPGEPQYPMMLVPGARAPRPGSGWITPREWMSPEQAYFNAAVLPGWQRHMPTYRLGVATAVHYDANTMDVNLDTHLSSAQSLSVDQRRDLRGVPVNYMRCHAAAFQAGDRVVVELNGDWASPTVIGFESNPRDCDEWPAFLNVNIGSRGSIPSQLTPNLNSEGKTAYAESESTETDSGDVLETRYALTGNAIEPGIGSSVSTSVFGAAEIVLEVANALQSPSILFRRDLIAAEGDEVTIASGTASGGGTSGSLSHNAYSVGAINNGTSLYKWEAGLSEQSVTQFVNSIGRSVTYYGIVGWKRRSGPLVILDELSAPPLHITDRNTGRTVRYQPVLRGKSSDRSSVRYEIDEPGVPTR